ncbi:MAG: hypothetical protein JO271_15020 [Verrucomicrobia bacterium]|nr:hypothetical protein [Verrucomicrobiota bacterium]
MNTRERSMPAVLRKLVAQIQSRRESPDESLFSILIRLEQQIRRELKVNCDSPTRKPGTQIAANRHSLMVPRSRYIE